MKPDIAQNGSAPTTAVLHLPEVSSENSLTVLSTRQAGEPVSSKRASDVAELAGINRDYPTLDADLAKARQDLVELEGKGEWSGLAWYEKLVFFIPPMGPLAGVGLLQGYQNDIRRATYDAYKLGRVASRKAQLETQIGVQGGDSFERMGT